MHTLSKMPTPTCQTMPEINPTTAPAGTVFVQLRRGWDHRAGRRITATTQITRWTPGGKARLDNGDLCSPEGPYYGHTSQLLRHKGGEGPSGLHWHPWTAELRDQLAVEANLRRAQRILEGIIEDAQDIVRGHKYADDAQILAALPIAHELAKALGITPLDIPEEVF